MNITKKTLSALLIMILSGTLLAGEEKSIQSKKDKKTIVKEDYVRIPVKFSLLPMIVLDKKTLVNFSLNLFGDYSTRLEGTSLGVGISIVGEDTIGAQIAAFGTITGRDMKYAQVSGLANFAGRDSTGFQGAGLFNITGGTLTGLQGAGLFNFTLKDTTGLQASSLFNISGGTVKGAQLAGIFNYAGSFKGLQASVFNIAGRKKPADKGAQIGVVNIARDVKGSQIGVFNFANNVEGVPFGLISIITNGETNADVWGDEMGMVRVSLKHGNKNFYNIYTVGTRGDTKLVSFGLGWGARTTISRFILGGDISAYNTGDSTRFFKGDQIFHASLRVYTGVKILKRLSIIGGVSYNYATNFGESSNGSPAMLKAAHDYNFDYSAKDHRFWPGFFVGVQM